MLWIGKRRLKLALYRVAVPKWTAGLNRYASGWDSTTNLASGPRRTIGVYAVLHRRCVSFVWRYA